MRISAILPRVFPHKETLKNNQCDYSQNRLPVLFSDTFVKNINFTASSPESVSGSRKPLENLYKEGLSCFCCGREMIDPEEITKLKESGALKGKASSVLKVLEKYKDSMHTVEQEVFDILKQEAEKQPNHDIRQIFQSIKNEHETQLVKTQFGIFRLIEKASENINPKQKKQIKELIEGEKEKIRQGDNKFRRKYFVNKFEEIFKNNKNTATKEHLLRLANKLPTSYENKSAFIVKYSNRNPEDIAVRLLSYSMCTIEHVKPKDNDGENHLFNYIPECMRCNSFRQSRPMIQQLEEHPEMFYNAQTLMDRLIDFANNGKLSRWYIIKIQKRVFDESDKLLKLDISNLQVNSKMLRDAKRINSTIARSNNKNLKLEPNEIALLETLNAVTNSKLSKKEKRKAQLKELHNLKYRNKKVETKRK